MELTVWKIDNLAENLPKFITKRDIKKERVEYDFENDRVLASGSKTTELLNPMTLQSKDEAWPFRFHHPAFSTNGNVIFGSNTDSAEINIYESKRSQQLLLRFQEMPDTHADGNGIQTIQISPDSTLVAVVYSDRVIRLWNACSGELLCTYRFPKNSAQNISVRFLRGSDQLVVSDGEKIQLFRTNSTGLPRSETQPFFYSEPTKSVAASRDLADLAIRHSKYTIHYRRNAKGSFDYVSRIRTSTSASSLVMSDDGSVMATNASGSSNLEKDSIDILRRNPDGQFPGIFPTFISKNPAKVNSAALIAISPDGKTLWGRDDSARDSVFRGHYLRSWDLESGRETTTSDAPLIQDLGTGSRMIQAIAATNRMGIAGTSQGAVILQDLATGTVHTLSTGNSAAVAVMAYAKDKEKLAVGKVDGSIVVIDLNSKSIDLSIAGKTKLPIDTLTIDAAGTRIAFAVREKQVHVMQAVDGVWIDNLTYPTSNVVRDLLLHQDGTQLLVNSENELSPRIIRIPE